jgi:hypothetical protein
MTALAPGAALAQEAAPAATPQRPSLSFNAWTVPQGRFEIESGVQQADDGAGVPFLLKYGLFDNLELEAGTDLIHTVRQGGISETSQGDLVLGVRARGRTVRKSAMAGLGWIKIPTADDNVGSGNVDLGATWIGSAVFDRLSLDLNAGLAVLGQGGGGYLTQTQAVATLGLPAAGRWLPFVETAWQKTAALGSGGAVSLGTAFAAAPTAVLDAAFGAGYNEGYPDLWLTVGWTILLGGPGNRR